ncbi:hypothetical protein CCB80_01605 [Armatimonadetes bacterium Uphvl-Ar1]|nr:hypothetical protein CCB80_01605 [Armatimonadetes bacterium Uphvl-Ar1]
MHPKGTSRITVFLSLAAGFLVLGLSCSYILYTGARENYFRQINSYLQTVAELAALQVDPENIASLNEPTQTNTPQFQTETDRLEKIVTATKNVTHISILKQVGPQYHFIVDASSQGSEQSKSNLLDPADEIPTELTQAVTARTSIFTDSSHSDRWGTWFSAYAPIFNNHSQLVGVVAVDSDANKINLGDLELLQKFQVTLAIVIAVCIGMAWLASGPITQSVRQGEVWKSSPHRRIVAEIFLVAVVLGIAFEMGQSHLRNIELVQTHNKVTANQALTSLTTKVLNTIQSGGIPNVTVQSDLEHKLTSNNYGQIADTFKEAIANPTSSSISKAEKSVESLARLQSASIERMNGLQEGQSSANLRLFIGIFLLSISTIVLVRYTANQEIRISQNLENTGSIQAQLSSLIENLPIGLFVIENGKITFANAEWKKQIGILPTQTDFHPDLLADAIHPDEREATVEKITEAVKQAKPFQVQYRIAKPGEPALHVETRAVPVYDTDGVCRQMLAFTVDLTATVIAKREVETAYGEVNHKNKLLADALAELEKNLESVVKSLVKAVEAKDPYTAGHSERVMQYSLWLGEAIGLGPYERRILELGTLVHDVGKIGIPDAILTKPDRLTDAEYDIIKKHPEYGVNIIGNIEMFRECLPIVRWHHERLDGRGYPDQLKGEEIPVLVRISAIADIFDAMTSTRAYRTGMELDKVLNIMNEISERGEIDAELFATFCQVIHKRGIIPQAVQQEPWKAA